MQEYQLNFDNHETYEYRIRRSERARNTSIRITAEGIVEVVIPMRGSESSAHALITKEKAWVQSALKKIAKRTAAAPSLRSTRYPAQLFLGLTGETFSIRYEWRDVPWAGARFSKENPGVIEVLGRILDTESHANAILELLRRRAVELLPPILEELAQKHGFEYRSSGVRLQKRRWGSCSHRKDISLNAFLIFFPREVVEYVLIHELCHLHEMNHSAAFWRKVEQYCPSSQMLRKKLHYESRKLPLVL